MKDAVFSIPRLSRAFSLVELLVVIAVIAIIAAIAIPGMLNLGNEANYVKDRRNAQTIALIANSAKAAGATEDLSTVTNAITLLQPPGVTAMLNGQALPFSISGMSESEQSNAATHLRDNPNSNGAVIFEP